MKIEINENPETNMCELTVDGDIIVFWAKSFEEEYQQPLEPQMYQEVYALDVKMDMLHVLFSDIKKTELSSRVKAGALVKLLTRFDKVVLDEKQELETIETIANDLDKSPV